MYSDIHVNHPLFFSGLNGIRIFSTDFRKIFKYQIWWNIRPVAAKLFYVDGQTDITNLIIAFRSFANAPKRQSKGSYLSSGKSLIQTSIEIVSSNFINYFSKIGLILFPYLSGPFPCVFPVKKHPFLIYRARFTSQLPATSCFNIQ